MNREKLAYIEKIIELHYQDSSFNVNALIECIGGNRGYALENIQSIVGFSPQKCIENKRLLLSLKLIASGMTLSRVACQCVFTSSKSFRRAFNRRLGISPSEYSTMVKSTTKAEEIQDLHRKLHPLTITVPK
jgi:AraC-like DNA-binding protein